MTQHTSVSDRTVRFPWLLFADAGMETAFKEHYFKINLSHGRLCHWLAILFYGADGIRDIFLFPDYLDQMMVIRFGIVAPLFVLGLVFSYVCPGLYQHVWQPLFGFYVLVTGGGVIAMTILIPPPLGPSLYIGLLYCLVFGYTFIRLRFIWATAAGFLLTAGYMAAAVWQVRLSTDLMWVQFPFVIGINFFGMAVAWHMESVSRNSFQLQELLRREKENVMAANEALEVRVRERTRDLEVSNLELQGKIQALGKSETEREKLETELRQAHKMEAIGTLAGGIAHDFNNILMSIMGYSELGLGEVEKGSPLEESLQGILAAGRRARDLVKQILAFARQSEETLIPIQVRPIAAEVLKLIRSSIPATIEIRSSFTGSGVILGNPTQVHQIVMNLCSNAAHAMEEEGGVLELGLADVRVGEGGSGAILPGSYVKLSVSDTGAGIDPGIINSIFEPYFTTKGHGEGTGMGLALVHGIVESYGGRIVVDSRPGRGTVFDVYIPVTRQGAAEAMHTPDALPGGNEHILIVDDDASITRIMERTLTRLGYRISSRTGSIEALALVRASARDIDLVITDMTMPMMTGDRLALEIMKIRSDLPVILCTGFSRRISKERAEVLGIRAYIQKPLVQAELAAAIRQVLDAAPA